MSRLPSRASSSSALLHYTAVVQCYDHSAAPRVLCTPAIPLSIGFQVCELCRVRGSSWHALAFTRGPFPYAPVLQSVTASPVFLYDEAGVDPAQREAPVLLLQRGVVDLAERRCMPSIATGQCRQLGDCSKRCCQSTAALHDLAQGGSLLRSTMIARHSPHTCPQDAPTAPRVLSAWEASVG